jgi:hypothetical protein
MAKAPKPDSAESRPYHRRAEPTSKTGSDESCQIFTPSSRGSMN